LTCVTHLGEDGAAVRTALAAALSLLAGLALAAPADAALRQFRSPSGNIGCLIDRGFARCDIAERDWPRPPRAKGCDLDLGQGLIVGRHGRA
jgi:hypothetical protein